MNQTIQIINKLTKQFFFKSKQAKISEKTKTKMSEYGSINYIFCVQYVASFSGFPIFDCPVRVL
jgi:hypothetical protein